MDNQHRKITGYRELDEAEIALVNAIKAQGEQLRELCDEVVMRAAGDARWEEVARTHFQQGLMALTRAVTRPTSF